MKMSLRERMQEFHEANPEVYELFKRFTFQVIRSGRKNFGVSAVWERMRWYTNIETVNDEYKLNNNHRAYYSRMFMEDYPQYAGFFRTRIVKDEHVGTMHDNALF